MQRIQRENKHSQIGTATHLEQREERENENERIIRRTGKKPSACEIDKKELVAPASLDSFILMQKFETKTFSLFMELNEKSVNKVGEKLSHFSSMKFDKKY